jgi:hypothetical protein
MRRTRIVLHLQPDDQPESPGAYEQARYALRVLEPGRGEPDVLRYTGIRQPTSAGVVLTVYEAVWWEEGDDG